MKWAAQEDTLHLLHIKLLIMWSVRKDVMLL